MRILTNMRFWQSPAWMRAVDSIYPGHRLPLGARPLSPLREALELCRRSGEYDVVVTMGARETLFYGLSCALRGRPSKQIACEVFADDPAPANPLWWLKQRLYTIVMRRAIGLLTNSSAEVDASVRRFGIPADRVRYVPLHTNVLHPEMSTEDSNFALSAGATRRDFATLIEAARQIPFPLTLVCAADQPLPDALPSHVTVRRAIPRDEYLRLVRTCSFMIVPLLPTERATGQVVVLEAMAFGKPVIATRAAGTTDLIAHETTGLLVPPFDVGALAHAIQRMAHDRNFRSKLGRAAFEHVLRAHTVDIHTQKKLAAIEDLYRAYGDRAASVAR